MKKQITVRQEHIDRGVQISPSGCAVALAISEAIPLSEMVLCTHTHVSIFSLAGDFYTRPFKVNFPQVVTDLIMDFDLCHGRHYSEKRRCLFWKPNLPLVFELELPDEFLAHEPKRSQGVEPSRDRSPVDVPGEQETLPAEEKLAQFE